MAEVATSEVAFAIARLRESWWGAGSLSDLQGCNRASGNGLVRDCRHTVERWWGQPGKPKFYWHEMWVAEDDSAPGLGKPQHHKLFTITEEPLPRRHDLWEKHLVPVESWGPGGYYHETLRRPLPRVIAGVEEAREAADRLARTTAQGQRVLI